MGHQHLSWTSVLLGAGVVGMVIVLLTLNAISPWLAALLVIGALGVGSIGLRVLYRLARHTPLSLGHERFRDQPAIVIEDLAPQGRVRFHGENWAARLDEPFAGQVVLRGQRVRVVGLEDLSLIIAPTVGELVQEAQDHPLLEPPSRPK